MIKTNTIIQHDVTKDFPLPDSCIDVVITSPPYWGLRDYGVDGQIGLEQHPQEYIDKLVNVCREIKRVLKKSGSFYLNLGDTYFGGGNTTGQTGKEDDLHRMQNYAKEDYYKQRNKLRSNWMQPKQLMLIPVRVAIALQDDGWVLRNDIIWHKPNPMPSSVKDRLNNTFEHVFHFVKSKKYYYDLDAIREPHRTQENRPFGIVRNRLYEYDSKLNGIRNNPYKEGEYGHYHTGKDYNPDGKNPGDFWDITTQPFTSYSRDLEHFAVFPKELIIKPLKASCPSGGVVLDPFCGRGTVGRVAKELDLNYVLFDISPDYCELAHLYVNGQKCKLIKNQGRLET